MSIRPTDRQPRRAKFVSIFEAVVMTTAYVVCLSIIHLLGIIMLSSLYLRERRYPSSQ
ncbi:hypothetical protein BDV59DRAFT_182134 [Aspergillus ambiguus]|uniref:uncharacterized protein n=1 Tax=Aspergillus ambiguus TaxID=176160 RepID=UPI003CCD6F92